MKNKIFREEARIQSLLIEQKCLQWFGDVKRMNRISLSERTLQSNLKGRDMWEGPKQDGLAGCWKTIKSWQEFKKESLQKERKEAPFFQQPISNGNVVKKRNRTSK